MSTQQLRPSYLAGDPGWYCDGCGATLTGGALRHGPKCGALATLADAAAQARIKDLRRIVTQLEYDLARKNRELDTMHYVWCDGGCSGGVHRWSDALVTRELVESAERNARRLRRWYRAVQFRLSMPGASAWQRERQERLAAKTDLQVTAPEPEPEQGRPKDG
jgi:hypothetical protein